MSDTVRYTGLVKIAFAHNEKRAILEAWDRFTENRPGWTTAAYVTPFVGTGASLLDATSSFSKGKILSGIGNTLFALASLIPGAGLLKGIGRGGQLAAGGAKGLARAAQIGKIVGKQNKFRQALNFLPTFGHNMTNARLWSKVPGASRIGAHSGEILRAARGMERIGRPFGGFKGMAAGMGLNIAGEAMHNPAAASSMGGQMADDIGARLGGNSGPVPFGTGGFFEREAPPTRGMSLRYFNPHADPNTLPFSGMPTPRR